jgi:hypothetical protein
MDRIDEARDQLNLAERETEQIPVGTLAVLPYPGALWTSILLREKKTEEGEALTKDIEKMVRAMPGPDAWSAARFELESIERTSRQAGEGGFTRKCLRFASVRPTPCVKQICCSSLLSAFGRPSRHLHTSELRCK